MKTLARISALVLALGLAGTAFAGPVNINTADARTLARELDGVGDSKAAAIIAYREKHGPFQSVDDLKKVQGIGEATLERNRDKLTVESVKPAALPSRK